MDLTNTTTSPDTENGTPPSPHPHPHPLKSLSFTNGALKNHPQQPPPQLIYKECLKNHAASLGGHALDGCGEFMPSPTTTPNNPTSLKCAACGCHRNFHRRDPDETTHFLEFHHPPPPHLNSPSSSPPPPLPPNFTYPPHTLLALRTSLPEDRTIMMTPVTPTAPKTENSSGRKRFRTKFSQEQKEKMLSFAEKLGWKMQKCDETIVDNVCSEIGVGKSVLKVWLHNNKSTLGKINNKINNNILSNGTISFDNNPHNINNDSTNSQPHNETSGGHLHVSTNGSSSSS